MIKITETSEVTALGETPLFRLENSSGAWVELSVLGAGILGVGVPDRDGRIENVALAYSAVADYYADGPNMGKCPGRYANRIAHGKLVIGDKAYQLNLNLPPHHLHGGAKGFQNQLWKARIVPGGVEFSHFSEAGTENYPGNVSVTITYLWSEDNELTIDFFATTDEDTVLNLTNHTYWNLSGGDSGSVLDHEMKMKASRYLETDNTLVPTGKLEPVASTPMDFSDFKKLGEDIANDFEPLKIAKGYDHCWVIDEWEPGRMSQEAVEIRDARSGRTLTIDSDQPGVQIYTGNWLEGSPRNSSGRYYHDYDGVAVEMQGFPDAPNRPEFPSQLLKPEETYRRRITYSFGLF